MNALIVATIAVGLLVDQWWAGPGQLAVNAVAWLVFVTLWVRSASPQRPALLACLLFAWNGRDTLGPLLYLLFVACLYLSPSRRLYATMFLLALAMEIYGTWLGNWTWSRQVPWLGLAADNPPLAAGAFYCVLDLLVVTATIKWGRTPVNCPQPTRD